MNKQILFRADGNSKIGLGHLYRVFAIIEMLKENFECTLVTRSDSEISIIPKTYKVKLIPEEIDVKKEAMWLLKNFQIKLNIIIADGYTFNAAYQKKIKKIGYKLIYIDDLTTIQMYADFVVNHSLSVKPEHFTTKLKTRFGLGTKYAMLRPSFVEVAKSNKKAKNIEQVFVSFGGADFYDLTSKAVEALTHFKFINKIHVLIGAAYKHQNIFKIEKENNNIIIYNNLDELGVLKLMKRTQLAIIPASTISYEVCSVKMLTICGYFVDNQMSIYNGLKKYNTIIPAGDYTKYDVLRFKDVINDALGINLKEQKLMLDNQKELFDGNQKKRFLKIINTINL